MLTKTHDLPIRIYYEDTDAGGIVYHANYLRYAERGRSEWLRSLGIQSSKLQAEQGCSFVVKICDIDYKYPAKLDDELVVRTSVAKIGGASLALNQDIYKENQLYVSIKITLVLIDTDYKPLRMSDEMKSLLKG